MKLKEAIERFCAHAQTQDVPALSFSTLWQEDAKHYASPDEQLTSWCAWWDAGIRAYRDRTPPSAIAYGYRKAGAWVRLLAMEHAQRAPEGWDSVKGGTMVCPVCGDDPASWKRCTAYYTDEKCPMK